MTHFCLRQLRKMTVQESLLLLLLQINCLEEFRGQGSFDKGLVRPNMLNKVLTSLK